MRTEREVFSNVWFQKIGRVIGNLKGDRSLKSKQLLLLNYARVGTKTEFFRGIVRGGGQTQKNPLWNWAMDIFGKITISSSFLICSFG